MVGVVLDAEQVVTEVVASRATRHAVRVGGVRDEEVAELEGVPVVQIPLEWWRRSFDSHDFLWTCRKLATMTSGVTAIVLVIFHGSRT